MARQMPIAPKLARTLAISVAVSILILIWLTHEVLDSNPNDIFLANVPAARHPDPLYHRDYSTVHDSFSKTHTCFDGNRNTTFPQVPSFIIIGAQKSGTSSLFQYLVEHPDVVPTLNYLRHNSTEAHFFDWHYVKRSGPREVEFWNEHNITTKDEFYCKMRQYYADLFPLSTGGTMALDKTPVYLFLPYVPIFIKLTCPWLNKLVVILRNPVDRAYSHYWFDYAAGKDLEPFEVRVNQELEYMRQKGLSVVSNITHDDSKHFSGDLTFDSPLRRQDKWFLQNYEGNVPECSNLLRGMYAMQLRQWFKYFKSEEILVIKFDDLEQDFRGVYQRILKYVGLPQHNLDSINKRLHISKLYRPMRNGTRQFLTKFYEPYNEQLADLLGEEWRGVWK